VKELLERATRIRDAVNAFVTGTASMPADKFLAVDQADFDALETSFLLLLNATRRLAGEQNVAEVETPATPSNENIKKLFGVAEQGIADFCRAKPEEYDQETCNEFVEVFTFLHAAIHQLAELRRGTVAL